MRYFRIVPNDVVRSGSASYHLDPIAKKVSYSLKAFVKKWLFKKTIDETGTLDINPDDYKSDKFRHVGKALKFGPLSVLVVQVKDNTCKADVWAEQGNVKGKAYFDLSEEHVNLVSLSATGSYMGITFKVNLQPDNP